MSYISECGFQSMLRGCYGNKITRYLLPLKPLKLFTVSLYSTMPLVSKQVPQHDIVSSYKSAILTCGTKQNVKIIHAKDAARYVCVAF